MSEKPSWTKGGPEAVARTARGRGFTTSRRTLGGWANTISITPVSNRTGAPGGTAALGGQRVTKDTPRIAACRTSHEALRKIQNELFALGSELGTPREAEYEGMFRVGEAEVTALERLMDHCQKDLEPLKSFTLPGGGRINAFLHQARTVCRRAEREVLKLSRAEPINEWALRYVNRLSDAFFVLGRWVGKRMGEKEYLWERGLASHARPKRKRS